MYLSTVWKGPMYVSVQSSKLLKLSTDLSLSRHLFMVSGLFNNFTNLNQALTHSSQNQALKIDAMKVDVKEKLQYLTENQESVVEKMGNLKLLVNSVKEEVNMTNLNWANNLDRLNDQSFEMEKLRNSLLRIQESQNELNKKDQNLNDSIPEQNVTDN